MKHRRSFLLAFLVVALLTAGGVLFATSHHQVAATPGSMSSVSNVPSGIDYSSDTSPLTCPAGCPVLPSDCPTDGHPCTCPDGAHGKCCVMGTSISCVRNH